jgi:hypothetical protein
MSHGRHGFPPAARRKVGKERARQLTADISKCIAVEEEKRSAAMAMPQEV